MGLWVPGVFRKLCEVFLKRIQAQAQKGKPNEQGPRISSKVQASTECAGNKRTCETKRYPNQTEQDELKELDVLIRLKSERNYTAHPLRQLSG